MDDREESELFQLLARLALGEVASPADAERLGALPPRFRRALRDAGRMITIRSSERLRERRVLPVLVGAELADAWRECRSLLEEAGRLAIPCVVLLPVRAFSWPEWVERLYELKEMQERLGHLQALRVLDGDEEEKLRAACVAQFVFQGSLSVESDGFEEG